MSTLDRPLAGTSFTRPFPTRPLRILSVPPRHPYIEAVTPTGARPVAVNRTVGWEPDPIFVPGTLDALGDGVDVVHVHFSYDHLDVTTMRQWLDTVRALRIPLVLTVHDLRNPHHKTRLDHDRLLAELVPAADTVTTLTQGAASEIARRFGVIAQVIPHPTLSEPLRAAKVETEVGLATLHLKALRRNVVGALAIVRAAAEGAADAGGRLRVDAHPEALHHPSLRGLESVSGIELAVHSRYDDAELERYVRRAHVTVLPYRWGTHSGWLELARDLGTRVVAPDCGYYADQWNDVISYTNNETVGFDPVSLRAAVARALREAPPAPASRAQRLAEASVVRRAHEVLYRRLTA